MSMYRIATITGNTAGTVAFQNIPQNFNHLQLRVTMRSTFNSGENFYLRFNNATYSYSGHNLVGNGAGGSVVSQSYTGLNYFDGPGMANNSLATNIFGTYIVDIFDYNSTTKNKTLKTFGGFDANGSGFVQLVSALVQTTEPITAISQIGGTAGLGMLAASKFELYGIKDSLATGA